MKIIEDKYENIFSTDKISVALGTFDGVHIGHQRIISSAVEYARENNIKSAVCTFNVRPLKILNPQQETDILTDNMTKANIIEALGVDYIFFVEFNLSFANIEAEDFLVWLKKNLNTQGIVCGYNYTFGKFGRGNIDLLNQYKSILGYDLNVVKKVSINDKDISSSIIREKMQHGEVEEANTLLGYNYFYAGEVIKGKMLGRNLGFPTANIKIPENLCLKNGVYITLATFDGKTYPSISNLGYNPTIESDYRVIETHLLNYNGSIYGKKIKVEFIHFIREEIKFDSIEELQKRVLLDLKAARKYFYND